MKTGGALLLALMPPLPFAAIKGPGELAPSTLLRRVTAGGSAP